jgi:hypothetical protein
MVSSNMQAYLLLVYEKPIPSYVMVAKCALLEMKPCKVRRNEKEWSQLDLLQKVARSTELCAFLREHNEEAIRTKHRSKIAVSMTSTCNARRSMADNLI